MYEKIVELIENNRFEPPGSYKEDAKQDEDHGDYSGGVGVGGVVCGVGHER
jgi:hypothetical protein